MSDNLYVPDALASGELRFGDFCISGPHGPLRKSEAVVNLPRTPLALLWALATRAGQVVTKEQLLDIVWPRVVVTEGVITASLRDLRRALGDDARRPRFIATAHRIGYRFIAAVTGPVSRLGLKDGAVPTALKFAPSSAQWVGRTEELARLRAAYFRALGGDRQMVFVTGDAGIGKSRLLEAFAASVESDARESLNDGELGLRVGHGQCIEHYGGGEPYLPILEAVTRLCRRPGGHSLLALLRKHAPTWMEQLPGLLQDGPSTVSAPTQSRAGSVHRMMREMAEAIDAASAQQPLILILEDMHWSDRSTVDWLAMLARRRERARLLVLATCRPVELIVYEHPFKVMKQELVARSGATEILLGCLAPADVQDYVAQRLPTESQTGMAATAVSRRSQGHPLFMVHMTDDLQRYAGIAQPAVPPYGVAELIEAQLTRLAPELLAVLEAASVAGSEFAAASAAAALERSTVDVESLLQTLARQLQFIDARGLAEWGDGTLSGRYGFRHDVHRDVLYRRIGAVARARMHGHIGARLALACHAHGADGAAELALHFENARQPQQAAHYRSGAAQKAMQRYAHQEADAHATRGLELLKEPLAHPDDALELKLLLTKGAAQLAIRGYGAQEVETTYKRALALSIRLDERDSIGPALSGLFNLYLTRGVFSRVSEIAEQVQSVIRRLPDTVLSMLAHCIRGTARLFIGEPVAALQHVTKSLGHYDASAHRLLAATYGEDPAVACHHIATLACWITGSPRAAHEHLGAGYVLARSLGHAFGEAQMLWMDAVLRLDDGDIEAVEHLTLRLTHFCVEHEFPLWLAGGQILRGAALAAQGRLGEGCAVTDDGLSAWRAAGTLLTLPHALAVAARLRTLDGRYTQALELVEEALEIVSRTGECWYEPELHRLVGELALTRQEDLPADPQRAETSFERALVLSRQHGTRLFEVRASSALATLWLSQGHTAKALAILRQACVAAVDMEHSRDGRRLSELLAQHGLALNAVTPGPSPG